MSLSRVLGCEYIGFDQSGCLEFMLFICDSGFVETPVLINTTTYYVLRAVRTSSTEDPSRTY